MAETQDSAANTAQIDYWNTGAGETWAEFQTQLDRQTEPLGLEAMRALSPQPGERILDIGCGCGQSTLQLAERVGPDGAVVGIDISQPMLEVARGRAAPASGGRIAFREIDAQTGELGRGQFDAVYSRFGVMFFGDPTAAFVNIRAALKPGARMAFVCWRPLAENPLMRAPMQAAAPLLPPLPPPDPLAPGPFAFADPERVRRILSEAGFSGVDIAAFDTPVGGGSQDEALALAFRIGPLGAALRANPESREKVVEAVREAIQSYVEGGRVQMPAAVWIVTARNG